MSFSAFDATFDRLLAETIARHGALDTGRDLPQRAFDLAISFHVGALRCFADEHLGGGSVESCAPPGVVNLAFSAELYLKSKLSLEGKNGCGHDIGKLYERLSTASRRELETRYVTLTGRSISQARADIKDCAEAFVEWRYLFENTGAPKVLIVHRLAAFARVLFEEACSNSPTWSVEKHLSDKITSDSSLSTTSLASFSTGKSFRFKVSQT